LVKRFQIQDLLPSSQELTMGTYPEPFESSPHPISLKFILILWSHLHFDLPSGFFCAWFPIFLRSFDRPMHATYTAHLYFIS